MNGKSPMPDALSFLVKPASFSCNLRCEYCFYRRVGGMYAGGTLMDDGTLEAFIEKALSCGASFNSFCWQGGEPTLMGLDFFRRAVDLQEKYREPGRVVENTIQTNGIAIDEEWCRFFRERNFLVGVSLDGPADIHDRYRRCAKGEGSFDAVMRGISLMKRHRVQFNILTLLTDANVGRADRLYSFFRENNFHFLQFIACCDRDPDTGELTGYSVRGEQVGDFYCRLFDLWMRDGFPHVSIRMFEDILIYFFDRVRASCCWMDACASYIVVEHNGDCFPCDFFVYPEWRLGNIVSDDLSFILAGARREKFAKMKSRIDPACGACRIFDFCQGDCTRFRSYSRETGFQGRSEYCGSLKMLIERIEPRLPEIERVVAAIRRDTVRKKDKVGRNEPCPCGSGRKYKHCCGFNQ